MPPAGNGDKSSSPGGSGRVVRRRRKRFRKRSPDKDARQQASVAAVERKATGNREHPTESGPANRQFDAPKKAHDVPYVGHGRSGRGADHVVGRHRRLGVADGRPPYAETGSLERREFYWVCLRHEAIRLYSRGVLLFNTIKAARVVLLVCVVAPMRGRTRSSSGMATIPLKRGRSLRRSRTPPSNRFPPSGAIADSESTSHIVVAGTGGEEESSPSPVVRGSAAVGGTAGTTGGVVGAETEESVGQVVIAVLGEVEKECVCLGEAALVAGVTSGSSSVGGGGRGGRGPQPPRWLLFREQQRELRVKAERSILRRRSPGGAEGHQQVSHHPLTHYGGGSPAAGPSESAASLLQQCIRGGKASESDVKMSRGDEDACGGGGRMHADPPRFSAGPAAAAAAAACGT
eukprot:GHVU01124262.1.p1 GENE.GHVU01124262.1~~GHVU01124262.1.p1  ORF type:complete len:404 (+),score=50.94 GHVU01124262.1:1255-2466(+)